MTKEERSAVLIVVEGTRAERRARQLLQAAEQGLVRAGMIGRGPLDAGECLEYRLVGAVSVELDEAVLPQQGTQQLAQRRRDAALVLREKPGVEGELTPGVDVGHAGDG